MILVDEGSVQLVFTSFAFEHWLCCDARTYTVTYRCFSGPTRESLQRWFLSVQTSPSFKRRSVKHVPNRSKHRYRVPRQTTTCGMFFVSVSEFSAASCMEGNGFSWMRLQHFFVKLFFFFKIPRTTFVIDNADMDPKCVFCCFSCYCVALVGILLGLTCIFCALTGFLLAFCSFCWILCVLGVFLLL